MRWGACGPYSTKTVGLNPACVHVRLQSVPPTVQRQLRRADSAADVSADSFLHCPQDELSDLSRGVTPAFTPTQSGTDSSAPARLQHRARCGRKTD